jgi:hypothetical protein
LECGGVDCEYSVRDVARLCIIRYTDDARPNTNQMLDSIHYKKVPFTERQGKYHVQGSFPGIPVMNPNLPSHITNTDLLQSYYSNQYRAAQSVQ